MNAGVEVTDSPLQGQVRKTDNRKNIFIRKKRKKLLEEDEV